MRARDHRNDEETTTKKKLGGKDDAADANAAAPPLLKKGNSHNSDFDLLIYGVSSPISPPPVNPPAKHPASQAGRGRVRTEDTEEARGLIPINLFRFLSRPLCLSGRIEARIQRTPFEFSRRP